MHALRASAEYEIECIMLHIEHSNNVATGYKLALLNQCHTLVRFTTHAIQILVLRLLNWSPDLLYRPHVLLNWSPNLPPDLLYYRCPD